MIKKQSKSTKWGLLDIGHNFVRPSSETINGTFEAIRLAEDLGYSRYWLAEHHNINLAWASPEILVGLLAGLTKKIRIGPAGIVLKFHSPVKVAENFKLLSTLFPDRIDLGIARGMADDVFMKAIQSKPLGKKAYDALFDQKVDDLIAFLFNKFPKNHPFKSIVIPPIGSNATPEIWILGSGSTSVKLAAKHGAAFSYSLFLSGYKGGAKRDERIMNKLTENYNHSGLYKEVSSSIAISGVCAKTSKEIKKIKTVNFPPPNIIGTPNEWKEYISELKEIYGVNEFVFLDLCSDYKDKLKSYEVLANTFDLSSL